MSLKTHEYSVLHHLLPVQNIVLTLYQFKVFNFLLSSVYKALCFPYMKFQVKELIFGDFDLYQMLISPWKQWIDATRPILNQTQLQQLGE